MLSEILEHPFILESLNSVERTQEPGKTAYEYRWNTEGF